MINTLENATTIASHEMRPRTLAPWATNAYDTAAKSAAATTGTPFSGAVGVEAGIRVTDLRDSVAPQGAPPPRENPR